MNTKEVLTAIEKLADKLGTTAIELFGYFLKEAKLYKIYFWVELIVGVIFSIIGIVLADNTYLAIFDDEYTILQLFGFIIGCIFSLIGIIIFIVSLFSITSYIRAIKNPEYDAISNLFSKTIKDN